MQTILDGLALRLSLASLAIAMAPLVASADARLIVLNKSEDRVVLVDPVTLELKVALATGQAPHEVAVSPDQRRAYVSNYGLSAVFRDDGRRRNVPGHTITVIDLEAGTVRDSFDLGAYTMPHGIQVSRDGTLLWVTCEGAHAVLELDATSGAVRRAWKTGQEVSHMVVATPDEKKLYVSNIGSGTITVIDRDRELVTSVVSGAGTEGIDVSPDGREVWATNRSDNTIAVLDVATDSIVARFPSAGQMPIRVKFTPDGRQVLVSNARTNSVALFDAASRRRTGLVKVGAVPVGIQITPDGAHAFVACTNDDEVKLLDLKSRRVTKTFSPGKEPDGLAWSRGRP
jgi:YVTN family beta-propeller protein